MTMESTVSSSMEGADERILSTIVEGDLVCVEANAQLEQNAKVLQLFVDRKVSDPDSGLYRLNRLSSEEVFGDFTDNLLRTFVEELHPLFGTCSGMLNTVIEEHLNREKAYLATYLSSPDSSVETSDDMLKNAQVASKEVDELISDNAIGVFSMALNMLDEALIDCEEFGCEEVIGLTSEELSLATANMLSGCAKEIWVRVVEYFSLVYTSAAHRDETYYYRHKSVVSSSNCLQPVMDNLVISMEQRFMPHLHKLSGMVPELTTQH